MKIAEDAPHRETARQARERAAQSDRDRYILLTVRRTMGDAMADRLAASTADGEGTPVFRIHASARAGE